MIIKEIFIYNVKDDEECCKYFVDYNVDFSMF